MNSLLLTVVLLAAPSKAAAPVDSQKAAEAARTLRQKLIDGFEQGCGADFHTPLCAAQRGALHLQMIEDLRVLRRSQDASMLGEALEASEIDDVLVQLAALDYVTFALSEATEAQRQALHRRALALINDPVPGLSARAAYFLKNDPDEAASKLAEQYAENRQLLPAREPWEEIVTSLPPSPAPAKVQLYPKGDRFISLETDRSAAFLTDDAPELVTAWFAKATGVKPLDKDGWAQWLRAHQQAYFPKADPRVQAYLQGNDPEFNKLMKQVQDAASKPQNLEALAAAQKKLQAYVESITSNQEPLEEHPGILALNLNPQENLKVFLLEVKQERAARIAIVYREPTLGRTVYAVAWDPKFISGK